MCEPTSRRAVPAEVVRDRAIDLDLLRMRLHRAQRQMARVEPDGFYNRDEFGAIYVLLYQDLPELCELLRRHAHRFPMFHTTTGVPK